MRQSSFSDLEYAHKKKRTRKEVFLAEMDAVLPWPKLLKPIRKHYPNGRYGRPPIALEIMLRIHFLQQWYALSDPSMEDSLYDIESMRRFVGVDLESIPDETTICKFRHFLERHDLPTKLLQISDAHLSDRGLLVNEGTIVDASIIAASPSTKNKAKQRDPDMKQTRKGNEWYFGMKLHIGTDTQGYVHSAAATNAGVHESVVMEDLIHGKETVLYGDKGYVSADRKKKYESMGVAWRINRKAVRGRQLTNADRAFNYRNNQVRSFVEHVFGVIKHQWGYRKVRYKGLEKNANQVFTLCALANFYRARSALLAPPG